MDGEAVRAESNQDEINSKKRELQRNREVARCHEPEEPRSPCPISLSRESRRCEVGSRRKDIKRNKGVCVYVCRQVVVVVSRMGQPETLLPKWEKQVVYARVACMFCRSVFLPAQNNRHKKQRGIKRMPGQKAYKYIHPAPI